MFRIILATAKSVQSRSPVTLRYTRPFTPDTSPRQQSSLAQAPFRDSFETPDSDFGSLLADCDVSCPPFTVIKNATESKTQQTQKLHAHDDGRRAEDTATPPETAPATPIKRRMGRPPKPKAPKGPPKKRGPKPKPKIEKPERIPKPLGRPPGTRNHVPSKRSPRASKLRIEQTENISARGSTITFSKLESRSKRSDFTSGNIRKDILSYLAWAGGKGRSLGDISRINIVSESLCGMVADLVSSVMRLISIR
jgi:transcription factor 1